MQYNDTSSFKLLYKYVSACVYVFIYLLVIYLFACYLFLLYIIFNFKQLKQILCLLTCVPDSYDNM
jgi:hypothetical protein